MKLCYSNLADRAAYFRAIKLMPFLLLPIGLAGVTTPTYLGYRTEALAQKRAEQSSLVAKERERAWRALGPIDTHLAGLRNLKQTLEEWIPEWQEEVLAHGSIRKAASDVGLRLERIQFEEPKRVGNVLNGQVVVERVATLSGDGSDFAGLQLVDALREQGWPVALHSLDLIRSDQAGSPARHTLKIGLFHYAPTAGFTNISNQETPSKTHLEGPVL